MSATGQTSIVLNDSTSYDPIQGASTRKRSKHKTRALAEAYVYSVPGFNAYKWSITPLDYDDWHEVTMESVSGSYSGSGSTTVNNDPSAPLVDAWELVPNLAEKDILESSFVDALTAAEKKEILDAVNASGALPTFAGTNAATMTKIAKLMVGGLKYVRILAPTIRHTRIMRRDFTVAQAYDRVGSVFTTSSLRSYENVPSQVLFDLPNTADPSRGDSLNFNYGWLKKPASIQQISGGQWQIVQEYDWGLWSEDIYGATV